MNKAKITWNDGTSYQGDIKEQNIADGKGKFIFLNGNFYEGDYKQNKANGNGTLTLSNGHQYTGDWKEDL